MIPLGRTSQIVPTPKVRGAAVCKPLSDVLKFIATQLRCLQYTEEQVSQALVSIVEELTAGTAPLNEDGTLDQERLSQRYPAQGKPAWLIPLWANLTFFALLIGYAVWTMVLDSGQGLGVSADLGLLVEIVLITVPCVLMGVVLLRRRRLSPEVKAALAAFPADGYPVPTSPNEPTPSDDA